MITVRRAAGPDLAALAEFRAMEPGRFATWTTAHVDSHLPFVAETAGTIVGMAWLLVAERVPGGDNPHRLFADVQSVFVRPEFRDRGIGAALLSAVLEEATRQRLEHVTVHSSERATPLYLRVGFENDPQWLRWLPSGGS